MVLSISEDARKSGWSIRGILFFCSIGKYEKEFLITLQRLVAPPALGNWGAKQEL
jgi:hypothetical protein